MIVPKTKIKRNKKELIERLINHLELLIEYAEKAFSKYEQDKYIGEVAGKLRLLVTNFGHNKPLLLDLMHSFDYERHFYLYNFKKPFTLRTYMLFYVGYSKGKYNYTNERLIRHVAQQMGAAHEDSEISSELFYAKDTNQNIRFDDTNFVYSILRRITNTVLSEAEFFLVYLYQNKDFNKYVSDYGLSRLLAINTQFHRLMDISIENRKKRGINIQPMKKDYESYTKMIMSGKIRKNMKFEILGIVSHKTYKRHGPTKPIVSIKKEY